ncbi:hypothetical protein TrVGV298_011725 [Trichoderma virens]|nr:hypothetical protein TrVGV298_011725 [Trichoderma virens]
MIGDAVLRLVIVDDGIINGKTTQKCEQICRVEASNYVLSRTLVKRKIYKYVKLPPCQNGTISQGICASTAEALIGAVWIDSERDSTTVHRVIHNLGIATEFSDDDGWW